MAVCWRCGAEEVHTGHLRLELLELPWPLDERPERYHREVLEAALAELGDGWEALTDRSEALLRGVGRTSTHSPVAGSALREACTRLLNLVDRPDFMPLFTEWARLELTVVLSRQAQRALWQAKVGCERVSPKGPLARAAELRPANFKSLSAEQQWAIDKRLGILDWDGSPEK